MLRTRLSPLLAELHAHTTWSDGILGVPALVDLYGSQGFDVLCITDHTCNGLTHITAANYHDYLAEIEREAARASEQYGLLVIPGLELTYSGTDPGESAHALAVGLRSFVSVALGIDERSRRPLRPAPRWSRRTRTTTRPHRRGTLPIRVG